MSTRRHALLYAHIAALFFGGTALFAQLIALPAMHITFWRSLVAVAGMVAIQVARRRPLGLASRRDVGTQLLLGLLLGAHWWSYFAAIQASTVAVGVTALYASPVITALLEPLLLHRGRATVLDVILGIVVLVGVGLLVPDLHLEGASVAGVGLGLLSALCLSLRNILHRREQGTYGPLQLLIYQVVGICLMFAVVPWANPQPLTGHTIGLLVVLGLVFTAAPHTCVVVALQGLSAKTLSLVTSLMVVYATTAAWVFLDEVPGPLTLLGAALVLTAATLESMQPHPPAGQTAPS